MENCIFCRIARGELKSWTVYETKTTLAFLDLNPVSRYHTLVIPKKHYENIFDIPKKDLKDLIATVKELAKIYENKLNIKNIQILNNSGKEAQQEVNHIHFHLIPRKDKDGQNINLKKFPKLVDEYEDMIKKLKKK